MKSVFHLTGSTGKENQHFMELNPRLKNLRLKPEEALFLSQIKLSSTEESVKQPRVEKIKKSQGPLPPSLETTQQDWADKLQSLSQKIEQVQRTLRTETEAITQQKLADLSRQTQEIQKSILAKLGEQEAKNASINKEWDAKFQNLNLRLTEALKKNSQEKFRFMDNHTKQEWVKQNQDFVRKIESLQSSLRTETKIMLQQKLAESTKLQEEPIRGKFASLEKELEQVLIRLEETQKHQAEMTFKTLQEWTSRFQDLIQKTQEIQKPIQSKMEELEVKHEFKNKAWNSQIRDLGFKLEASLQSSQEKINFLEEALTQALDQFSNSQKENSASLEETKQGWADKLQTLFHKIESVQISLRTETETILQQKLVALLQAEQEPVQEKLCSLENNLRQITARLEEAQKLHSAVAAKAVKENSSSLEQTKLEWADKLQNLFSKMDGIQGSLQENLGSLETELSQIKNWVEETNKSLSETTQSQFRDLDLKLEERFKPCQEKISLLEITLKQTIDQIASVQKGSLSSLEQTKMEWAEKLRLLVLKIDEGQNVLRGETQILLQQTLENFSQTRQEPLRIKLLLLEKELGQIANRLEETQRNQSEAALKVTQEWNTRFQDLSQQIENVQSPVRQKLENLEKSSTKALSELERIEKEQEASRRETIRQFQDSENRLLENQELLKQRIDISDSSLHQIKPQLHHFGLEIKGFKEKLEASQNQIAGILQSELEIHAGERAEKLSAIMEDHLWNKLQKDLPAAFVKFRSGIIFFAFLLLCQVFFLTGYLPHLYKNTMGSIHQIIEETLASKNLEYWVGKTVSGQAPEIIEKTTRTIFKEGQAKYVSDFTALKEEKQYLEKRNSIAKFEDQAIRSGDRQAYNELRYILQNPSNPSELSTAAAASLEKIKTYYQQSSGLGLHGEPTENSPSSTPEAALLLNLKTHPDWKMRVEAAQKLSEKHNASNDVLEALLQAALNDSHLAVVKSSLEAFDKLTGYKNLDIFGAEYAATWWKNSKNKL